MGLNFENLYGSNTFGYTGTEANRPVVFSKEQINFFSISRTITESQSHPFHTVMDLSTFSPELVAEIRARIQSELRATRNQVERDIEALDEAHMQPSSRRRVACRRCALLFSPFP